MLNGPETEVVNRASAHDHRHPCGTDHFPFPGGASAPGTRVKELSTSPL
jgi:hypothetical protein